MRTLKLLFILIAVTLSLPKGAEAQYMQPMRYPHYSVEQQFNIGVGTARQTAASAYLEVGPTSGANKGFLPPRLSTTERDAIASPANGLMIYNKTTNNFQGYNGSAWVNFYIDTNSRFITSFYRIGDTVKYILGGVHYAGFKDSTGGGNFGLQDILATSARRFSGGGNTFTLDSLGATTIRTYTTSAIKMVATNGTDSAWMEMQRGTPASGKKVIFWAKHSTTALNYMQITGGGFTTSITNPTSGDGSSITTTSQSHALISSNGSDFSTININKDTIALLSTSATSGLKISGILKRNSSPDLKLVKIDTTNGQISYYDDGTVAGTYVPDTRILTINGVAYDLSADRSWTVIPDSTFYTANGTITYARRINANGYPITFDSTGLFRIRDTSVSSTGALYGHIYDFNDGVDFLDYDSILTVGYTQNSLTGIHLYVKDKNDLDTSIYLKLNPDNILLQGITKTNSRLEKAQGADVASAAGAITLGADGNSFEITGTSSITAISNINWQNGSEIILMFTSTATLVDGTANSGTDIGFELAGNANFTASAGAVWKGILSEIGGTQRWREVSRTVN